MPTETRKTKSHKLKFAGLGVLCVAAAVPASAAAVLLRRTFVLSGARNEAKSVAVLGRVLFKYGAAYRLGNALLTAVATVAVHRIGAATTTTTSTKVARSTPASTPKIAETYPGPKHAPAAEKLSEEQQSTTTTTTRTSSSASPMVSFALGFLSLAATVGSHPLRVANVMHCTDNYTNLKRAATNSVKTLINTLAAAAKDRLTYTTIEEQKETGYKPMRFPSNKKLGWWYLWRNSMMPQAVCCSLVPIILTHPWVIRKMALIVGKKKGEDQNRKDDVFLLKAQMIRLFTSTALLYMFQQQIDNGIQLMAHYSNNPAAALVDTTNRSKHAGYFQSPLVSLFGTESAVAGAIAFGGGLVISSVADGLPVLGGLLALHSGLV